MTTADTAASSRSANNQHEQPDEPHRDIPTRTIRENDADADAGTADQHENENEDKDDPILLTQSRKTRSSPARVGVVVHDDATNSRPASSSEAIVQTIMSPPSRSTMLFERFVTDDGTIVMFMIILCYGMYSVGSLLKKYLLSWSWSWSAAARATTKNQKNKKSPKISKNSSLVTNTNEGEHEPPQDPKTATRTTTPTVIPRNSSRPPHPDETADLSVEELDLIARLAGNYPQGTTTPTTASTPTPITPSRLQRPSLLSAMKDPAGTKYALKHNLAYEDTRDDDGVESSDAD